MPKGKGTKVFVTMMLLALALTLILPTVASAQPLIDHNGPWRGGGAASGIVYGTGYNTDDVPYVRMEVHAYLYERIGWWWVKCASAVNSEEGKSYCFTTAQVVEVYNEFYVKCQHKWDIDGNSYDYDWTQSSHKWC